MSVIDVARNGPADRPDRADRTEIVRAYEDAYAEARSRARALAPMLHAERAALESIPPVEGRPRVSPVFRGLAHAGVVVAAGAGSMLVAPPEPLTIACGAAFGLAITAAGDALGTALRRIGARREWPARLCLAGAAFTHLAETAILAGAAGIVGQSPLAALGLGMLGAITAAIGHASRTDDAEVELRAAMRAAARRNLDAIEQAVWRDVDKLQTAHAADLARLAAETTPPLAGPQTAHAADLARLAAETTPPLAGPQNAASGAAQPAPNAAVQIATPDLARPRSTAGASVR